MNRKLYQLIASKVQAMKNCETCLAEYKHLDCLEIIKKEFLPSGSGFDSGTEIIFDKCNAEKIVLKSAYHTMNEHGFYTDWIHFEIIVKPSFIGINLAVKYAKYTPKKLKIDHDEFICDMFYEALDRELQDNEILQLQKVYKD